MWTPSFLAVHAAVGIAVLGLAVLVFDSARPGWLTRALDVVSWPVVALGRNALVLWIGVFVLGKVLSSTPAGPDGVPLATYLLEQRGPTGFFLLTAGRLAGRGERHARRPLVRPAVTAAPGYRARHARLRRP